MPLNLHLLRAFTAVVSHGSFSRAAEAIRVSQPAVSKAVRELENQLDMPLLERIGGQTRPTEAGQALYQHARAIFALERVALADIQGRRGLDHGQLTVGASMTIATYLLPPLLRRFLDDHPGIEMKLVSDNTETIERRLLAYDLDIAFVEGPVRDPRVEVISWRDDPLVILAAADHPLHDQPHISPVQLSQQRWIVREAGSGTRAVTAPMLENAGIRIQQMLEVGSTEATLQSVAAGLGLAMVSLDAARDQLAAGRVRTVELEGVQFRRPLHRIGLRDRPLSPAARTFVAMTGKAGSGNT